MSVSIGNELKDSFKETTNWVNNNIQFLTDVEQFYRQRAQLENQYANDLNKLCADYHKKKANKTISISVGDEPKITPGSLESASLVTWTEILSQTELVAKNHLNLGNEFNIKISDQIIALQKHLNLLNDKVINFHNNNFLKKKNLIYEDVNKSKKNYDETCNVMEQTRLKAEKSLNKDKHDKKLKEKQIEMNNAKNEYLLKINIANRIKDKFYYQDLPEILDIFQDLIEFKTKKLNNLLSLSSNLEINNNNKNNQNLNNCIQIIKENKSQLDIQMFIKHNQINWSYPQDFYYIPSSIWHDDENFITSNQELTHLKTILLKANQTNEKYDSVLESARETLNNLQNKRDLFKSKDDDSFELKPSMDILNNYLLILSNFIIDETTKVIAQVEIETIENNANNKDLSLDGLIIQKKKKGIMGRLTGSKPKETIIDTTSNTFDDTHSIKSSSTSKSSKSHFHMPSLRRNKQSIHSSISTAIALYPYESQDQDELTIFANEELSIITPDDNGWTLVSNSKGDQGTVPTSYLQISCTSNGKKKGPEVTPRKGAKKISYVEALYDYKADGDDEMTIKAGEKIQVIEIDNGSGWTLGEIDGNRGLFPTSYVKNI